MAIDFEMPPRQRKLKYDAREFAREVLRPVAERADAIVDPQEAFVAMKPVFEAADALGFTTSFLPAKYGGGGASIVDTLIVTEELAAVDGGFPTIVLVNGLALMPLAWFGTDKQCAEWIGRAVDRANPDFLAGWVVSERGGGGRTSTIRARWPASSSSPGRTWPTARSSSTARSTGRATREAGIWAAPTCASCGPTP
jgi:nitroalkane oxidase